jgi:hypothetical protein
LRHFVCRLGGDGNADHAHIEQVLDKPLVTAKAAARHARNRGDVAHAKVVAPGLNVKHEKAAYPDPEVDERCLLLALEAPPDAFDNGDRDARHPEVWVGVLD